MNEYERRTKNRILRQLKELGPYLIHSQKKGKGIGDAVPIAALALEVAHKLQTTARELRECAKDLGYTE